MAGDRSPRPPERRGGATDAAGHLVLGLILAAAGLLLTRRDGPGDLPTWVGVAFLVVPGGLWALFSALRLTGALLRPRTTRLSTDEDEPAPRCPDGPAV